MRHVTCSVCCPRPPGLKGGRRDSSCQMLVTTLARTPACRLGSPAGPEPTQAGLEPLHPSFPAVSSRRPSRARTLPGDCPSQAPPNSSACQFLQGSVSWGPQPHARLAALNCQISAPTPRASGRTVVLGSGPASQELAVRSLSRPQPPSCSIEVLKPHLNRPRTPGTALPFSWRPLLCGLERASINTQHSGPSSWPRLGSRMKVTLVVLLLVWDWRPPSLEISCLRPLTRSWGRLPHMARAGHLSLALSTVPSCSSPLRSVRVLWTGRITEHLLVPGSTRLPPRAPAQGCSVV